MVGSGVSEAGPEMSFFIPRDSTGSAAGNFERDLTMAKKTDVVIPQNGEVRPPAGMARIGSVANAPWWHLANGNVLHGELENVYERPDERSKSGKSKFFQIKLLAPTIARKGRGKDAEIVTVPTGHVVNVNYGPKTKELEKFVPDIMRGAIYTVWLHVDGEKFEIGRGQTMWPIDVRATVTVAPRATEESDPDFSDDDDGEAEGDAAQA